MKLHKITRHLLALHEVFRRLGFKSENLYVLWLDKQNRVELGLAQDKRADDGNPVIVFRVVVDMNVPNETIGELAKNWPAAVTWWNEDVPGNRSKKENIYAAVPVNRTMLLKALAESKLWPVPVIQ